MKHYTTPSAAVLTLQENDVIRTSTAVKPGKIDGAGHGEYVEY